MLFVFVFSTFQGIQYSVHCIFKSFAEPSINRARRRLHPPARPLSPWITSPRRTAQKLHKSSSSGSFQRFKDALVRAARSKLTRQSSGNMANHQQRQQAATDAAVARLQVWADSKNGEGGTPVTRETVERGGRAPPTKVEPDLQERHPSAMVVAAGSTPSGAVAHGKGKGVTAAVTLQAVPVSPPSSPTHVSTQQMVARMASAGAPAAATAAAPVAGARSGEKSVVNQQSTVELQESPGGSGGAPTTPAAVEIPLLSAISDGKESVESNAAVAIAGPTAPARLGRGRKRCPNCKATTKSAVKQCRECNHVFSPASSRLRAPSQEPKENEDEQMPARRRLRPSQRLIEYELYETSTAAGDESNGPPMRSTRRPLGASSAGGDANQRVDSSVSGGRPAMANNAASKTLASTGGAEVPAQLPKRSHKRKVPLPPGVSPPKRKKGAAAKAAADAAASGAAANAEETVGTAIKDRVHQLMPLTSLPERQRIAEDLVATHTTAVPTSPELIPAATPAGPLLFMPSNTSPDEDTGWLSTSVGPSSRTPFALQAHQLCKSQGTVVPSAPIPSPFVEDILMGERREESGPRTRLEPDAVTDLSVENHSKDPFEGVQLWLEGVGGGDDRAASGFPTSTMTPGTVGELSQRVLSNNDLELLGDGEGDLLWSPLRTSSVNDGISSVASSISNMSLWLDGNSGSDPSSQGSSDVTLPNFERGAALASAVALGSGCGGGDFDMEIMRSESIGDFQGVLLGDGSLGSMADIRRR